MESNSDNRGRASSTGRGPDQATLSGTNPVSLRYMRTVQQLEKKKEEVDQLFIEAKTLDQQNKKLKEENNRLLSEVKAKSDNERLKHEEMELLERQLKQQQQRLQQYIDNEYQAMKRDETEDISRAGAAPPLQLPMSNGATNELAALARNIFSKALGNENGPTKTTDAAKGPSTAGDNNEASATADFADTQDDVKTVSVLSAKRAALLKEKRQQSLKAQEEIANYLNKQSQLSEAIIQNYNNRLSEKDEQILKISNLLKDKEKELMLLYKSKDEADNKIFELETISSNQKTLLTEKDKLLREAETRENNLKNVIKIINHNYKSNEQESLRAEEMEAKALLGLKHEVELLTSDNSRLRQTLQEERQLYARAKESFYGGPGEGPGYHTLLAKIKALHEAQLRIDLSEVTALTLQCEGLLRDIQLISKEKETWRLKAERAEEEIARLLRLNDQQKHQGERTSSEPKLTQEARHRRSDATRTISSCTALSRYALPATPAEAATEGRDCNHCGNAPLVACLQDEVKALKGRLKTMEEEKNKLLKSETELRMQSKLLQQKFDLFKAQQESSDSSNNALVLLKEEQEKLIKEKAIIIELAKEKELLLEQEIVRLKNDAITLQRNGPIDINAAANNKGTLNIDAISINDETALRLRHCEQRITEQDALLTKRAQLLQDYSTDLVKLQLLLQELLFVASHAGQFAESCVPPDLLQKLSRAMAVADLPGPYDAFYVERGGISGGNNTVLDEKLLLQTLRCKDTLEAFRTGLFLRQELVKVKGLAKYLLQREYNERANLSQIAPAGADGINTSNDIGREPLSATAVPKAINNCQQLGANDSVGANTARDSKAHRGGNGRRREWREAASGVGEALPGEALPATQSDIATLEQLRSGYGQGSASAAPPDANHVADPREEPSQAQDALLLAQAQKGIDSYSFCSGGHPSLREVIEGDRQYLSPPRHTLSTSLSLPEQFADATLLLLRDPVNMAKWASRRRQLLNETDNTLRH